MTIMEGLQLIDSHDLPHPEWEFVKTSKDLKNFYNTDDYVGWTIRTVEIEPWHNIYANWVKKEEVPAKVDELQNQHKNTAIFVVYPSWKWKKGGTILIEPNRTVIEAVNGPVINLMRHGELTAAYHYTENLEEIGEKDFLTAEEREIILQAKKIPLTNIILEWGITTQDKFIFYRIEDIAEAGKLLIKKYEG